VATGDSVDLVGVVSGLVVWEGVLVGVLLSRRSGTAWSMVCLRYIAGVLITISGGAGGLFLWCRQVWGSFWVAVLLPGASAT